MPILDNLTTIVMLWAIATVVAIAWISFCCSDDKDDD